MTPPLDLIVLSLALLCLAVYLAWYWLKGPPTDHTDGNMGPGL